MSAHDGIHYQQHCNRRIDMGGKQCGKHDGYDSCHDYNPKHDACLHFVFISLHDDLYAADGSEDCQCPDGDDLGQRQCVVADGRWMGQPDEGLECLFSFSCIEIPAQEKPVGKSRPYDSCEESARVERTQIYHEQIDEWYEIQKPWEYHASQPEAEKGMKHRCGSIWRFVALEQEIDSGNEQWGNPYVM